MILSKFKDITTLIFDVDGVLTNSGVLVLENGQLLRTMSIRDGYALKKAVESGFNVVIITGGKSEGVVKRLQRLGVADIYYGISNKLEVLEDYMYNYELTPAEVLYMGDDIPDLACMQKVGLPVCPMDAAPEIKAVAQYISPVEGGQGCARDVIEKVLKLNGKWV